MKNSPGVGLREAGAASTGRLIFGKQARSREGVCRFAFLQEGERYLFPLFSATHHEIVPAQDRSAAASRVRTGQAGKMRRL
jgi:hypothetical protein